jgi:hypothetical protein
MFLQEKKINVLEILFPDDWEHRELNFPFLNAVLNYYERHQSLPEDQSTTTNVVPDTIIAGSVDSTLVNFETNHSDSIAQDSFLPHLYPPFVAYNNDNSNNYTGKDSFLPELYPPFCAYNDNGNYDLSLLFLLPEYSNDFFLNCYVADNRDNSNKEYLFCESCCDIIKPEFIPVNATTTTNTHLVELYPSGEEVDEEQQCNSSSSSSSSSSMAI